MKNWFSLLVLILAGSNCFSQTLVSTVNLELKKPWDKRQLTSVLSPDGRHFFVFASDKKKIYALKYNQALFFRDSISIDKPTKDADFIAGTSFDQSGNPYLHWFSENHSKLISVGFDFDQRKTSTAQSSFSYDKETFLNSFNADGTFFVLTVSDDEQKILFRSFSDGKPQSHILDFSPFEIVSQSGKKIKLSSFFEQFPLQFIESGAFCPLSTAASVAKIYLHKGSLILSLDHDSRHTQLFSISLTDYSIREIKNSQPELPAPFASKANSFLTDKGFFQIRISQKELSVSFEPSFEDGNNETIAYLANDENPIDFRSSALFFQTGNSKPSELKSTSKFMKRLDGSTPGISAYHSEEGIILTCGGIRQGINTRNAILAGALGIGTMAAGGSVSYPGNWFDASELQQVYFESFMDDTFKPKSELPLPIATDFLSGFFSQNDNLTAYSISRLPKFELLAYYDSGKKAIVLRKFEDASDDAFSPE